MELAPRYKLLALLTMLRLVTHTIAFHCLNISKYTYIYIVREGKSAIVKEWWAIEQKVGLDWMDG